MECLRPQKENICAVIVTYHPDNGIRERIERILMQVGAAVVVDNNSPAEKQSLLSKISSCNPGCYIINNIDNLGIATALNQGVKWAKEKGFHWVLLFDQDSVINEDMVESLAEVYDAYPDKARLAVIGSNYTDSYTKRQLQEVKQEEKCLWFEKKTTITSGSLIPVSVFDRVGFFRDEFFIDHVDDDFCMKARNKGFKVILTVKEIMQHSLGASTMHRFLWKYRGTTNHSPLRRYYMTRNHFILVKEYFFKEPAWVFNTVFSRIKMTILMCLFEKNRSQKLKAILKGLYHGLFNITKKSWKNTER